MIFGNETTEKWILFLKKMKKKMLFIFAKNISEIEVPKAERLFVHLLAKMEPVFSTLFFTCMFHCQ